MLEPRRLAARGAAERLAEGLGEPVGQQVGYSVRLETRSSAHTRLEVLTGGLFLRRLQADPALEGVACVIFDEFHERTAEADLALALTRQARALLRPDLRLLLMSATLDLEPLADQLDGARVISSQGRSHPVSVTHQPPRPDERLERQVLRALEQHWLGQRGPRETVLVFLPGQREIQASLRLLLEQPWAAGLECCPLHGQLPLEAQRRAIQQARGAAGKVVLSTSIAESSLTIEGVALVIDSGMSRLSRFDPGTGMDGLVTVPSSLASAEQRRGRAGRLGPGRCLRLWSPAEQKRRPPFDSRRCAWWIRCRSPCSWRPGAARLGTICPGWNRRHRRRCAKRAGCWSSWEPSTARPALKRTAARPASARTARRWPVSASTPGWRTCCCGRASTAGWRQPRRWRC